MSVGINEPRIQQIIADANRGAEPNPEGPDLVEPTDSVFTLAAGYLQDDGQWVREFEVRELTGRDEEAFARISGVGRVLVAMLERGVVRLGSDPATPDRLNSLVAGDWDTALIAIRAATFGPEMEIKPTCLGCQVQYEVTIDLTKDLLIRTASPEDLSWTVQGKRQTYEVSCYTGGTQRRLYELMANDSPTLAVLNTEILRDSITKIDNFPVLGKDEIRDMPMADRRQILNSIQDHRVGPDFGEVTIKCPTCGHEQQYTLSTAALFQWN